MKKVFLLIACLFAFSHFYGQASKDTTISLKALAITYKRKGVEVYVLSEPVKPYSVTGTVTDDDVSSWADALSGKETRHTLAQSIDILIQNANRKAKKKKFEFDAIITEDGTTGTCIKFDQ